MLGSRRLVEMANACILSFCQKVFDVGLGKKMVFPCHEAWQGKMEWENKRFHQDWAHLGKVANATFVNPRNQQKWTLQDLVMQIYSPWCTTWCSVIIWGYEHVHKSWDQKEKVANVELIKFGSGQEGFSGPLIKLTCSPICATWSRWIIRTFEHVQKVWEHLGMFGNVKLLKLQNGQKWFWGDLMMLSCSPRQETCQDHQIWHLWHDGIFLDFLWKYFL